MDPVTAGTANATAGVSASLPGKVARSISGSDLSQIPDVVTADKDSSLKISAAISQSGSKVAAPSPSASSDNLAMLSGSSTANVPDLMFTPVGSESSGGNPASSMLPPLLNNNNSKGARSATAPGSSNQQFPASLLSNSPGNADRPVSPSNTTAAAFGKLDVQQQAAASMFNGLGRCAVFPVPASSLTNSSIWSTLLSASAAYPDLSMNPYGLITLSISDLLEITLPPVDAGSLSAWPRPPSYYKVGLGSSGLTHCPPAQHIYRPPASGVVVSSSQFSGDAADGSASDRQQPINQGDRLQASKDPKLVVRSDQFGNVTQGGGFDQGQQFSSNNQMEFSDPYGRSGSIKQYAGVNDHQNNGGSSTQPQNTSSIASLKQMFPGVNMSFGGPPPNSSR